MKKYAMIVMLVGLLLLMSCTNETSVQPEDSNNETGVISDVIDETSASSDESNQVTEQVEMSNEESQESVKEEEKEEYVDEIQETQEETQEEITEESVGEIQVENSGEFVFKETVSTELAISINEEKVEKAIELGFSSPATVIDVYEYIPKNSDVIQFESPGDITKLGESLSHKGFEGLEIVYEKNICRWNDFFGDLDVSEEKRNITTDLKGDSIYEVEIVDEYSGFYRYYNEYKGLYYEVNDFMVGNYTDGSELTNARIGNVCNYNALEDLVAPTYNPLIMQNDEELINCFITSLDEKPCLYIESLYDNKLYKNWIDIEFGIVVKELIFDEEGLLKSKKIAMSITEKDISQYIFEEASDVEFQDITLFIYSLEGGDVETLVGAVDASVPDYETGILLTSDDGAEVTIFTSGMDDMKLDDVIYYSEVTLKSGETRTIREIVDNRFYTVCDELETVEIYDNSCYEKKFFNFEEVGILSVEITDKGKNYTFYDPNNISVSAMYDVYEYVIEDFEIKAINCYNIINIKENEPQGSIISYKISLIDFDASVYDETCMDTYKIIDHGEGSFDDGEYMPFWYSEGEE